MKPALLGGRPAFNSLIPLSRPYVRQKSSVLARLASMLDSGQLTDGPCAQELEHTVSERLGRECVAVSSCTTGLILTFKALGLSGEVIVPSFTFFASAHALLWNDLVPVFADCRPDSFTVDPQSVARLITPQTAAILAVNVFGNPPDLPALQHIAQKAGIPLIVDAAQGFGSESQGLPQGTVGHVEIFSLTPSKLVAAGEGGLVVTRDAELAAQIRALRNYGNTGNYDPESLGLNGRLSELHSAVALGSLDALEEHIALRHQVVQHYREALSEIKGLGFQVVRKNDKSVYKDLGIRVGHEFGCSRDTLMAALKAENIQTRSYFSPPVHKQRLYESFGTREPLHQTERLSEESLCLPIYATLSSAEIAQISSAIKQIQQYSAELTAPVPA